jgi:hypothetical protein
MNETMIIRRTIDQYLNQLSLERLNFIAEFLAYLADKESKVGWVERKRNPPFLSNERKPTIHPVAG